MPDTILCGDVTVHYPSENARQALEWTGSSDGTRTLNEVYSALQSLFDNPSQMEDLSPFRAVTPDIYAIQNQWYVDDTTVEHFTGGSLFSDGWFTAPCEFVVAIGYNPATTEFNAACIGRTIRGETTSDTGTILDFNIIRNLVWIRPCDPICTGDEFDNATEAYTIGAALLGDAAVQVLEDNCGVFTDDTVAFNCAGACSYAFFPACEVACDRAMFGFDQTYSMLRVDIDTAGVGGAVTWEYSTGGDTWSPLACVGGCLINLLVAGCQVLTFTVPTDWATDTINAGSKLYWIRANVDCVYCPNPLGGQGFISGVGDGIFATHLRHGPACEASVAGEAAWAGVTTIGAIEPESHLYIFQEDMDAAPSSYTEEKILAIKGTSDWWKDGQIDILLKTLCQDSVIGVTPGSSPVTGIATVLARQYSKLGSNFIATALSTTGGNTVVPLAAADDLNNPTGYRNLVWDLGSAETLLDEELLYNVGTTTVGNIIAAISDNGGCFTCLTTEINNSCANNVVFFPAAETTNDAFYLGMDNTFSLVMFALGTQGVAACACAAVWEYFDNCCAWVSLVTGLIDDTDDGADDGRPFTACTGRRLLSFTVPTDWNRTNICCQPATAPTCLYYIRARILGCNTYGTQPLGTQGWAGGETQLKARVADIAIGCAAGACGNTDYYLLGDPLTDFVDNDVFISFGSRKTGDIAGGPTNTGPASTTLCITFLGTTLDINNGAGARPYHILLDNNGNPILDIYQRTKFLTRRGSVVAFNGQDGEEYLGTELQIEYTCNCCNFTQGARITGGTSLAEAVIAGDHDDGATGDLQVSQVRGTFVVGETITDPCCGTGVIASLRTIATVGANPLGTFAGGTFFGAPGVHFLLACLCGCDVQAYQLICDDGCTQIPPNVVQITVECLVCGDTVGVYRRNACCEICKTQFCLVAACQDDIIITVGACIGSCVPTNANSKIRVIASSGIEHRYRYDSFSGAVFTLAPLTTGTADACSTNVLLIDAAVNFVTAEVEVGDYIRNETDDFVVRITAICCATTISTEDGGATWLAKVYTINALVQDYLACTSAYVPLIERVASTCSESNTLIHSCNFNIRGNVRNAGVILPFTTDTNVIATGRTISTVRNADAIFT